MRCKGAARHFSSLLEGDIPESEGRKLQAHLDACPHCRQRLEGVRSVVSTLKELPEIPPTFEEQAKIEKAWRAELERELAPITRPVHHLARAATVAAAALFVGAAAVISVAVLQRAPAPVETAGAPSETASENDGRAAFGQELDWSAEGGTQAIHPAPQVVNASRAVARADMENYQADLGRKQEFYTNVWQPSQTGPATDTQEPIYDTAALSDMQKNLVADLATTAAGMGEDGPGLATAVTAVLQVANGHEVPLLPCYAEKVIFETRSAWIISLSGPEDIMLWQAETTTLEQVEKDKPPRRVFIIDAVEFRILYQ